MGDDVSCLSLERKSLNQIAFLMVWVLAMYLALVLERATVGCFFKLQLMALPPKVKM